MKEEIVQRLRELRAEFANGQRILDEMEVKQADVRKSMLRISGAIQVLEELLKQEELKKQEPEKVDEPLIQQEMTA